MAQDKNGVDRRTFLRGIGVAGVGAATAGTGLQFDAISPMDEAAACGPPCAFVVGAGVAIGAQYVMGSAGDGEDYDRVIEKSVLAEIDGLARGRMDGIAGRMTEVYNDIQGHGETNSLERVAWEQGAWAARDAWAEDKPLADVQADAEEAALKHVTGTIRNIHNGPMGLKQTVDRIKAWKDDIEAEDGLTVSDHIHEGSWQGDAVSIDEYDMMLPNGETMTSYEITGSDGEIWTVKDLQGDGSDNEWGAGWTEDASWNGTSDVLLLGGDTTAIDSSDRTAYYTAVGQAAEDAVTNAIADLDNWTEQLHDDIAAGKIAIEDTVSPSDMEQSMIDNGLPHGTASLLALGIPVDTGDLTTIETTQDGINWTLNGKFAAWGDPEEGFDVGDGTEYDPQDVDGAYMLTDWNSSYGTLSESQYVETIDGGLLRFVIDPAEYPSGFYEVETIAGENASVEPGADWNQVEYDGTDVWELDISNQLEDPTVNIEAVRLWQDAEDPETADTIPLEEPFTIESATDEDGQPVDTLTLDSLINRTEPDDWQTAEDFQQEGEYRRERMGRIVDALTDDYGLPNIGSIGSSARQWVLIAVAGIIGLFALNAASS